jgi:hypothetical protein
LHKDKIEPAIKLTTHLAKVSDLLETHSLMKSKRIDIIGIDAGNEDVLTQSFSFGNESFQQTTAKTSTTLIGSYMSV